MACSNSYIFYLAGDNYGANNFGSSQIIEEENDSMTEMLRDKVTALKKVDLSTYLLTMFFIYMFLGGLFRGICIWDMSVIALIAMHCGAMELFSLILW